MLRESSTQEQLSENPLSHLNRLYYRPSDDGLDDTKQDVLVFTIPGNPGIISYYQPFVAKLHDLVCKSAAGATSRFSAYGYSFANFGTERHVRKPRQTPYSLQEQIEYTEELIYREIYNQNESERRDPEDGPKFKVILIGHSVGAYILLEIIRRHQEQVEKRNIDFDLVGGILLFPTITDIAKSPMGMISDRLVRIPHLALIAGAFVKFWATLLPEGLLLRLIKLFGRFPEHAARDTARFLKSPMGVRQAIHLGKDELQTITGDKWEEEVWGAATSKGNDRHDTAHHNLFFYWGKNDRWVAQQTREDLMSARGQPYTEDALVGSDNSRPFMTIDEKGIPHAFVIKHSDEIASTVAEWVEKIVEAHAEQTSAF